MPNTSAKSWLNPSLTCLKKSKLLSKLWRTMNNLRMAAYPNELNALVYICSTKGNALRTHLLLDLGFGFSNFLMWISGNIFEKKRYRHNNNDTAAWVEGKKTNKETKKQKAGKWEVRFLFRLPATPSTIDPRPSTNHQPPPLTWIFGPLFPFFPYADFHLCKGHDHTTVNDVGGGIRKNQHVNLMQRSLFNERSLATRALAIVGRTTQRATVSFSNVIHGIFKQHATRSRIGRSGGRTATHTATVIHHG